MMGSAEARSPPPSHTHKAGVLSSVQVFTEDVGQPISQRALGSSCLGPYSLFAQCFLLFCFFIEHFVWARLGEEIDYSSYPQRSLAGETHK